MKTRRFTTGMALIIELMGVILLLKSFSSLVQPVILKEFSRPKSYLYFTLYAIVVVMIVYSIRKLNGQWKLKDLGFKFHHGFWKDMSFGVMLYAIIFLLNLPFKIAALPQHAEMMADNTYLTGPIFIALLILTWQCFSTGFFTGALHEELFYRGYLQGTFSRLTVPAIGLFISFLPFSFGHYFSHPEWNIIQVLNTLIPGLLFCLGYYATGSVLVPLVAHSLSNLVPFYPVLFYARGSMASAYVCYAILGLTALYILYRKRSDLKLLWQKSIEIFKTSGWLLSVLGVGLGVGLIFLKPTLFKTILSLKIGNVDPVIWLLTAGLLLVSISMAITARLKRVSLAP